VTPLKETAHDNEHLGCKNENADHFQPSSSLTSSTDVTYVEKSDDYLSEYFQKTIIEVYKRISWLV